MTDEGSLISLFEK